MVVQTSSPPKTVQIEVISVGMTVAGVTKWTAKEETALIDSMVWHKPQDTICIVSYAAAN
jgi:hypothetical protein